MTHKLFNRKSRPVNAPIPFDRRSAPNSGFMTMGGGGSRKTVLDTYNSNGTVHGIVSVLSTPVASSEWRLYKKPKADNRVRYTTSDRGTDQRVEVTQHAALTLWNNPNPFQTQFEFVEGFMQHLDLVGEAYWILDTENSPFPVAMWYARPDRMMPVSDGKNFLTGWIYTGPNSEQVPLSVDEVIPIRIPNPTDDHRGTGFVQPVMTTVEAARYASEWQRNYFYNEAEPGGIITMPNSLTSEEWETFNLRWRQAHQGISRAHRVALLENGMVWQNAETSMRDMDFANLRAVSRDEIRESATVHKAILGDSDDVNKANAQTAEEVHGKWQIIPRLNRIRDALNNKLLPKFDNNMYKASKAVEFDYVNPLPDDREADNFELTSKATAAQLLASTNIWEPADILTEVGLAPMREVVKPTLSAPQEVGMSQDSGEPAEDDNQGKTDLSQAEEQSIPPSGTNNYLKFGRK